jgi:hypothetical protein
MKKVIETPERILIYQDEELNRMNKKTLDEIFSEAKSMKAKFTEIGVKFNPENFVMTINEGLNWIADELFNIFIEHNYTGLSERVIEDLVDRQQFSKVVEMLEAPVSKLKELLKKIDLTPDQVPFDSENNPVINDELKEILSERSKRYAIGASEIELYNAILKFIESTNELEASLSKNGFPLLFTKYLNFDFPMLNAEIDSAFYPLCLVNYDNVLIDGKAELEINPEYFENVRTEMESLSERVKLEKELRSLPPEDRFSENRSPDIIVPAASFKLPKDAGKQVESGTKTQKRWAGMPGV